MLVEPRLDSGLIYPLVSRGHQPQPEVVAGLGVDVTNVFTLTSVLNVSSAVVIKIVPEVDLHRDGGDRGGRRVVVQVLPEAEPEAVGRRHDAASVRSRPGHRRGWPLPGK